MFTKNGRNLAVADNPVRAPAPRIARNTRHSNDLTTGRRVATCP